MILAKYNANHNIRHGIFLTEKEFIKTINLIARKCQLLSRQWLSLLCSKSPHRESNSLYSASTNDQILRHGTAVRRPVR